MPSEVVGKHKILLKDKYVGETKRQLRHGYGVYGYDNKFFRYEGQWKEGLKHGHGKLILGDGGYYEGTFVQGEMHGHGYRVFGLSGTTYSGQFDNGVIHGQGLLKKTDGEQYEGSWVHGKKEGEGILTYSDGGVYEGEFHDNKRHGEGRQIYSNGDQYEGDWVLGKRHGAGLLKCADGTLYDGQWRGDVYHGEGSISHASGVTYRGLWVNGRPENEPVSLRVTGESTVLTIDQGKTFSLNFECVDDSGELITSESGRSFKVSAAMRKPVARRKSRMSVQTSPPKDKMGTIVTPFGYSVQPYDLLQVPSVTDTTSTPNTIAPSGPVHTNENGETDKPKMVTFDTEKSPDKTGDESDLKPIDQVNRVHSQTKLPSDTSDEKPTELSTSSSTNIELSSTSKPSHGSGLKHTDSLPIPSSYALSSRETRSLLMGKKLSTLDSEETKVKKKDEDFLASLVKPFSSQITSGIGTFKDLYIPPPPLPDISHIIPPSLSKGASNPSLSSEMAKESSGNLSSKSSSKSPSRLGGQVSSPAHISKSPRASPSHSHRALATVMETRKSTEKLRTERDKLLQPKREKFALPGIYVLIISEVTNPPFLDSHLPGLFVEVKVVPQRSPNKQSIDKIVRSKSKLQTVSKIKLISDK